MNSLNQQEFEEMLKKMHEMSERMDRKEKTNNY